MLLVPLNYKTGQEKHAQWNEGASHLNCLILLLTSHQQHHSFGHIIVRTIKSIQSTLGDQIVRKMGKMKVGKMYLLIALASLNSRKGLETGYFRANQLAIE